MKKVCPDLPVMIQQVLKIMSYIWAFFQLNRVSDDVEDLVMKLFSATLQDATKRWYDNLPDKSIKNMDQLEETFLNRWSTKEDPITL
jgi:hypothetical protein